ncbi:uncharacterized protein LOC110434103 isoform X2 [Sorghum bicolor]|uniref:uncharacterized protein LOC110434103 isoform X2 n=1 Tax=Sorghum bicolor TaxID=4558 RepID=UPI000B426896|nr:uncharacterized protein LOC110434103 isoform X2 [Sorghum bicolor]|eukprot:XP_021313476.1 uncharacterized protein LOC110434103 isoform X2 [Sorghum bicolor]
MAPRFHVSAPWITAPRSWTAFSRGSDVAGSSAPQITAPSSAPQITAPSSLLQIGRRPSLPVDTVHIFISPLGSFSPKTEHEFGFNIWTIKSLICSIDLEEPECHVVEKVANQAMAGRPVVRTSTSRFLAVFQYLCAFVVILAR